MSAENNCKYVCSRGLMKSCDVFPVQPISSIKQVYPYDWSKLESGKSVYINTSAIPHFVATCFPQIPINVRFVLVSGDADETSPNDLFASHDDFLKFIEDPRILHWFSQNGMATHPKFTRIPIGLDYHTLASGRPHWWGPASTPVQQEKLLEAIAKKGKPVKDRKTIIYCNFHFNLTTPLSYDRTDALKQMLPKLLQLELQPQPRMKSWTAQTACAFVASPYGGGYDCHRTWEALALGCIPILHSSSLDPLFEGLPVLIVKKWSDITHKLLEETKKKYSAAPTDLPRLTLQHWVNLIKAASTAATATTANESQQN
jgi:hypothetical protein